MRSAIAPETMVAEVAQNTVWKMANAQSGTPAGRMWLWPVGLDLEGYERVFANSKIMRGYLNTIVYTVLGTLWQITFTVMAAYPLSRKMAGRKIITFYFVFTMYFGGGLIPTYLVVRDTGLLNTMWALFLPGGVAMGNVIIVRNFFENNIPKDLYEAAEIDGADNLTTFVRIVVPLSRPIMAVMVVFSMVAYWNDWFTALIYLQKAQYPFPLVLRGILITTEAMTSMTGGLSYAESNRIAELVKFAAMIVAAVPMLVMYPFVQKYFEQGFMTGAVKG